MNISQLFLDAAEKYPDRLAIIDPKQGISYADLQKDVLETAAYFRSKGIQKGDRVLVFVPMSVDLYRIVLALFYCGATAVFLDAWVNKKRLELCCQIADCKGFIGVPKARIFAWFSRELRRIPIKLAMKKQHSKIGEIESVSNDDSALITFTTGSTGRPKAADRTHGFLKEQFDALIDEIDPKVQDVDMPVLPIVLFVNLGVGCTSVIANFKMSKPETMESQKLVEQIQNHKVNRITASPFIVEQLAKKTSDKSVFDAIEKVFTGGAPVFPSQAKLLKGAFSNAAVNIVYGSTESEPISSIEAVELIANEDQVSEGLPVGHIYHKTELRIVKISEDAIPTATPDELNNLTLEDGTIGEIIVAGPHVLKRYFNNEEAFKKNKIVVGDTIWHRTGDSGFYKDGELYLTGRCQQLIYSNETILSPFIIENRLQEIPGVTMGTLLEINSKLILVLEGIHALEHDQKESLNLPFDEIKFKEIPRDPRHNSKIDYSALKSKLTV
ncbi:MAG: AMP-dependent synthetase [Fluviicola sp. XM-24bin1]|nr:MAG: AMP-dependent synthetase [Fluviicola sp. XM-24bin1]